MTVNWEKRAVSPVVGVVLMVAIVVVLSAVISTMVLGFGSDDPVPEVAFDTESDRYLTIKHTTGETLDTAELEFKQADPVLVPEEVGANDEMVVKPHNGVDEIHLVYDNIDDDTSTILRTFNLNELDVPTGPEPVPPQPIGRDCKHFSSDPGKVTIDRCVVIEEGVSVSGTVKNGDDLFLQDGAIVESGYNVNNDGDLILRSKAEVGTNIKGNVEDVFMGEDATAGDTGGATGDVVMRSGSSVSSNIKSSVDSLYLLPGSEVGGVVSSNNLYFESKSQISSNINTDSGDQHKVYEST